MILFDVRLKSLSLSHSHGAQASAGKREKEIKNEAFYFIEEYLIKMNVNMI